MDKHPIRQQLTARYEELRNRLARVSAESRHADKLNPDFAEQAVERENDEVLGSLDDAIRIEMAQIEGSLFRIDNGRYGVCESCGAAIPPKRLEALPHAIHCIACAAKHP